MNELAGSFETAARARTYEIYRGPVRCRSEAAIGCSVAEAGFHGFGEFQEF